LLARRFVFIHNANPNVRRKTPGGADQIWRCSRQFRTGAGRELIQLSESGDKADGKYLEVVIQAQREPGCDDLPLPEYQTAGSSGMDLRAAVEEVMSIKPGERALVPTGLRLAIPQGCEGQIRARSGLALREGIILPNAPGTIDSDYRGEVGVIVMNLGKRPFTIRRGDRIAQLVICPVARANLKVVDRIPETERGDGGFGHTGN
jgi:dUTP pyrophosphatase